MQHFILYYPNFNKINYLKQFSTNKSVFRLKTRDTKLAILCNKNSQNNQENKYYYLCYGIYAKLIVKKLVKFCPNEVAKN